MRRTLRYSQQVQLDPTTGVAVQQFRMNSLHDPDYTGTGHQPMGYDQLCPALYQQWWVTASKITIDAVFLTDAASIASVGINRCEFAFFATANDTTVPTTVDQMLENHNCKFHHLSGYQNRGRMEIALYHPPYFGVSEKQYIADDNYGGAAGSNPTRWVVGNLAACSGYQGSDTTLGAVEFQVMIEFDAIFMAPVVLGSS